MKSGRSLSELAVELERQAKSKRDFIADTRKLAAKPVENGIVLDGINGGMKLRPIAHGQLSSTLGIPKPYYDKMLSQKPDLLATNINTWLQVEPAKKLIRTLDGEVRAILSDSYRPLDNYDLAEAVLPQLQALNCRIESGQVTDSRLYLKAVTDRITGMVKKGDVVQAGIVVSNSEVGNGSLAIAMLDFRLVCLNGMIGESLIRKAHLGRAAKGGEILEDAREFFKDDTRKADDRAFFLKVRDTVKLGFDHEKFSQRLDKYREAGERQIENNAVEVVAEVANHFGLTEKDQGGILQHLVKGGDLSQWGLANAVTRYSQDIEDYDRATELERVGGQVIELSRTTWNDMAV